MSGSNIVVTIIIACLGSQALMSFIQFLISRKDKKNDTKDELIKDIKEIKNMCNIHEKDICRSQLLLLISSYPEDRTEIMKLAEHYFTDLKANWYMSSIFNTWLNQHNLNKPDWFNS